MNQLDENDPLDVLLREQNPHVDDDGFTARVISTLPRRQTRSWWPRFFLLGVTTIGWMLAMWWLPWENLPPLSLSALLSPNSAVLLPWVLVLSVMGSLIWAVVAAVQWED